MENESMELELSQETKPTVKKRSKATINEVAPVASTVENFDEGQAWQGYGKKKQKETLEQFIETKVERALEDALANPKHLDLLASLGSMEDNRVWFSRYFHDELRSRMGEDYPADFIRHKMLEFSGNIYTCTTIAKIYSTFFADQPSPVERYSQHFYGYVFGEILAEMEDTRLMLQNAVSIIQMPQWLMNIDVVDTWMIIIVMRYRLGAPLSPRGNRLGRQGIDEILDAQPMPARLRSIFYQKLDIIVPRLGEMMKINNEERHYLYHSLESTILS